MAFSLSRTSITHGFIHFYRFAGNNTKSSGKALSCPSTKLLGVNAYLLESRKRRITRTVRIENAMCAFVDVPHSRNLFSNAMLDLCPRR